MHKILHIKAKYLSIFITVLLLTITFSVCFIVGSDSTGDILTLKWTTSYDGGHFHPVMGDIDNDGDMEIVNTGAGTLSVINGKSGVLEWIKYSEVSGRQLELMDLDNDGTPEIVTPGPGLTVVAVNGDGTIRWISDPVNGGEFPGTPITGCDIDGDGYPSIYVVTYDLNSPYTSCITRLDHEGNILCESEICYKPCWGGVSMADADFNGYFEIYLGDRSSSGGPGGSSTPYPDNPARGLSCYNATTLETMWTRPDLSHSSPTPVLADVAGDENLEVIGNNIYNNGCCVVNAITGEDIYNWKGKQIENHAKSTLYDIDYDGHVELISCCGYSDWGYTSFTVFDLITGEIEFKPDINDAVTYPPTVGDVTGDGYMEILCAVSTEPGHGTVGEGQLIIYDRNYNELERITGYPDGEQLWEPRVFDCDGDGLNELIVGSRSGHIWCYDTPAPVSDPAPRTWRNWYSEYRAGAAEYVEPPGPKEPVIKNEFPLDNADDISLNPLLSVEIYDFQRDLFDVIFEINGGSSWQTIQTYNDQSVTSFTTFTANTNGYVDSYDTEYDWRVTVADSKGNTDQKTFSFTTESGPVNHPPYTPNNPDPYNGETDVDVNHNLDWDGDDPDGDTVYYDVYFGTDSTPDSGEFKTTTTSSNYNPGTMNEGTTYYWRINAFDEHGKPANPQGSTWHFTTESAPVNHPPVFSGAAPSDDATGVSVDIMSLGITVNDPDGDLFEWSIETSPNIGSALNSSDSNGYKSCSISGLEYSTTYHWFVNATDGYGWTREWFTFTTRSLYIPSPPSGFTASADGCCCIDLSWSKDVSSDATLVEWNSISGSWNRGEGIELYNGSSESTSQSGLDPETTRYYQAWSWNETDGTWSSSYSTDHTTTKAETSSPPSPPPPDDGDEEQNNSTNSPPETPTITSGPESVEIGMECSYTTSSFDVDADQIRYRFDWGADNYSNWTEFVSSNVSVSMSCSWNQNSTYEIRVIAQDESGTNSSWSLPFNVTILQPEQVEELPTTAIDISYTMFSNQTAKFNASDFFAFDDVMLYYWDFGDGANGTGKNPIHIYGTPGQYNVTLFMTDSSGMMFSKSIIVTITSEASGQIEEKQDIVLFGLVMIIVGFAIVLIFLTEFSRDFISLFLSYRKIRLFPHKKRVYYYREKKKDSGKTRNAKTGEYYGDMQDNYIEHDCTDFSSRKKEFIDDIHTGITIDKVIGKELESHRNSVENNIGAERMESTLKSNRAVLVEVRDMFGNENIHYKNVEDDIERKVDDIIDSKR